MKYVLIQSCSDGISDAIACVTPMPEMLQSFLDEDPWFVLFGDDYVFNDLATWIKANPHLVNCKIREAEGGSYLSYNSKLLIYAITADEARAVRDAAIARYAIGDDNE